MGPNHSWELLQELEEVGQGKAEGRQQVPRKASQVDIELRWKHQDWLSGRDRVQSPAQEVGERQRSRPGSREMPKQG